MSPTATTNLSRPRLLAMDLVAASPTFRVVVGADDSTEAMASIHSPFSDDRMIDKLDEHGDPVIEHGYPKKVRQHPMPRCTINHNDRERHKLGSAWGGGDGDLIVSFEFLPDPAAEGDKNLELLAFEEQVGKILDEMEERSGHDKLAGEGVMTEEGITHVNLVGWKLVDGPAQGDPQENQGELFYGVTFITSFKG